MAKEIKPSKAKLLVEALLEEAVKGVKSAKDLTSAHAPDIAREIVAEQTVRWQYDRLSCALAMFFGFPVFALSVFLCQMAREASGDGFGYGVGCGLTGLASLVLFGIGLTQFIYSSQQLAMLRVAPKKEVLDYLRRMLR